ncbi:MAG TPA: hypothetical protein PK325_10110 [Cyclobacteriaceae bacterium]|nr:hypothetical protein [Cyclobacteriaceae bacterium]HNF80491.1 hypothetical protein [Cyclobacteriaceae bacterium]HNG43057.1 hypothetical protein [Cyclobacteriaceae bacterium]HNH60542.1 hypothetical protein [Cyclobacteriaceae bacterium]HNK26927.1 hypothetical protein [Cyclobacteriaceae bacterium]
MAKQYRFDVGDKVHYIFGEEGAEYYKVIATRDKPHMRNGGPNDGELLYVEEGNDYIIVKYPLLPDRISPYVNCVDGELDEFNE